MKHAQRSGLLLLVTGVLHTLLGLATGYPWLLEMVRDGLIGAAGASVERQFFLWFLTSGVGLVLMGVLALGYNKPLPTGFGWGLLLLAACGVVLLPNSGFWLLLPQALYILVVAYRSRKRATETQTR